MGGSLNICSESGYDFGIMLFYPHKKNLEELSDRQNTSERVVAGGVGRRAKFSLLCDAGALPGVCC